MVLPLLECSDYRQQLLVMGFVACLRWDQFPQPERYWTPLTFFLEL